MAFTGLVLGGLSLGYQVYSGEKARKDRKKQLAMQRQSMAEEKRAREKAAAQTDQEYNKANRRTADVSAATDESLLAGRSGIQSTMLTGNMGIDPDELKLGRNTLLGS
tara:strand:+ start:303 stop:626 length:324 start_codon:yes stop_codon:yes gene_type:complete